MLRLGDLQGRGRGWSEPACGVSGGAGEVMGAGWVCFVCERQRNLSEVEDGKTLPGARDRP